MPTYQLVSFASDDALAHSVAARWLEEIAARGDIHAPLCVALSGGRVAGKFFAAAAQYVRAGSMSLAAAHFFWSDERCVPPTDAQSNFALAQANLLGPLSIQPDKVHRVRGEIPPDRAASEAEAEVCRLAPLDAGGQPVLDFIFLGMGEDGHVASLFPGAPEEVFLSRSVYFPVLASKPPPQRITISLATIAAARQVWVLASGTGKEEALRESLSAVGRTPLARVLASRVKTMIFTDIAKQEEQPA